MGQRGRRVVMTVAERWPRLAGWARTGVSRLAARHRVGALAVVLDDRGRVIVVRTALQPTRWTLPGGWVRAHEDPRAAAVREVREELGLDVVPQATVATEVHGRPPSRFVGRPSAISIVVACAPTGDTTLRPSVELLAAEWLPGAETLLRLSPFDASAVREALDRLDVSPDPQAS